MDKFRSSFGGDLFISGDCLKDLIIRDDAGQHLPKLFMVVVRPLVAPVVDICT